jgi:hypothetical protein
MTTFKIDIPFDNPEAMKEFQGMMDGLAITTLEYEKKVEDELGVTPEYAMAIVYLRTRSGHTPEMEQRLIDMCRCGKQCPDSVFNGEWR